MKRAPFLGAGAAVLLAGCGGHHVLRALPGVASTSTKTSRPQSGYLVPAAADPIPARVLAQPIIGEAWRFDGPVPPAGWTLAQGQTLNVHDNPKLFAILGTVAGGDGKTTFRLPNPGFGYAVAVAGLFATSRGMLEQSGRLRTAHTDSLGAGAVPVMVFARLKPERARAIADSQRLRGSAVRAAPGVPQPASDEQRARYTQSRFETRDVALASLTASNVSVLQFELERVAGGTASLNDAVVRMTPLLSPGEAGALLAANDARYRAFRPWAGTTHADPQFEAARFAVSIGFTSDQLRRFVKLQS